MSNPSQTITVKDRGRGVSPQTANATIVLGTSSSGTVNIVQQFSRNTAVTDTLGEGPLPEMLCRLLTKGGPVYGVRLTGSVVGVAGAVTPTRVGTSTGTITVAGAPYDAYDVTVEIMTTGTVGTGEFKYSLDGTKSYSPKLLIPSGGTYAIPNTNMTLTFVPGAGAVFFQDGDLHTFTCTAPYYSTANLASAITGIRADATEFSLLVLTGKPADTADGATMFAALSTHMNTLASEGRYARAIMDAGDDTTTNAKTDFASSVNSRIAVCYGDANIASAKPIVGWSQPSMSSVVAVAERAASSLISTDLARVASGPLDTVTDISHDEHRNNQGMDDAKFTTLRSHQGEAGYFINNCNLKSATGSDFQYMQHGRLMDLACDMVFKKQTQKLSSGVRTVPGTGVIVEKDALRWEGEIKEVLEIKLFNPKNAEGTRGHVSAPPDYVIDRTQNIQSTNELVAEVSIVPLGYAKTITTTIGFQV